MQRHVYWYTKLNAVTSNRGVSKWRLFLSKNFPLTSGCAVLQDERKDDISKKRSQDKIWLQLHVAGVFNSSFQVLKSMFLTVKAFLLAFILDKSKVPVQPSEHWFLQNVIGSLKSYSKHSPQPYNFYCQSWVPKISGTALLSTLMLIALWWILTWEPCLDLNKVKGKLLTDVYDNCAHPNQRLTEDIKKYSLVQ